MLTAIIHLPSPVFSLFCTRQHWMYADRNLCQSSTWVRHGAKSPLSPVAGWELVIRSPDSQCQRAHMEIPSCSAHLGSDGKGEEEENFSCDNVLCRARLATAHQLAKLLVERAQSLNTLRMTGKRRQVTHADSPNMLLKMPTINFQQYVFSLLQPSEMLLKQQKKMLSNYSNKQPKRIKITVAV